MRETCVDLQSQGDYTLFRETERRNCPNVFKLIASLKVESSQLALLQTYIEGTLLSNMEDRWVWDLNGEGVFWVKDVRIILDECFLPKALD
ncbi:hypothetical protein Tco_1404005 [Tanacetum coccineum]